MRRFVSGFWVMAAAVAVVVMLPVGVWALSCGETVNSDVVMTADLMCATNPGVTISGGSLDMHGFKLTCTNPTDTGIVMTGSGGKLRNGGVQSCLVGVSAGGSGGHKIERMYAFGNSYSFQSPAASFSNKWLNDVAANSSVNGFDLAEGGSKVIGNTALITSFNGFSIGGTTATKIVDNISAVAGNNGISSDGVGSNLKGNIAMGNAGGGITFSGSGGKITKNYFTANGAFDMHDLTLGCGSNIWSANTFATSSQACEH